MTMTMEELKLIVTNDYDAEILVQAFVPSAHGTSLEEDVWPLLYEGVKDFYPQVLVQYLAGHHHTTARLELQDELTVAVGETVDKFVQEHFPGEDSEAIAERWGPRLRGLIEDWMLELMPDR